MPSIALLVRAPWSDLVDIYSHADATDGVDVAAAVRLSVVASVVTTVVSAILGVPLAWLLARVPFPGRALVRAAVTMPLVLPPVVGGLALLVGFGRRGSSAPGSTTPPGCRSPSRPRLSCSPRPLSQCPSWW